MDITKQSFSNYLPWLLTDLASSCFVAIDFEFSGIALSSGSFGTNAQTLQQRYAEIKDAAEKHTILQIGLTICRETPEKQTYILKPYNINLSPGVNQNLKIDRDWTFRASSAEFLMSSGFSIDAVCQQGVRYLSRDEEIKVREILNQRFQNDLKRREDDIQITGEDVLGFVNAVRSAIDEWLSQGEERLGFLNLPPPVRSSAGTAEGAMPTKLSNMQKRLIHQIVHKEYPNLKSRSVKLGFGFIQITHSDPKAEEKARHERLRQATASLAKDIGFRWIIEALVGGDLSGLRPLAFAPLMPLDPPAGCTFEEIANRLKKRLAENRPVIIGHNCLTDLVFMYRCFIGSLPATVEEFQVAIHELFPTILDTKYLATYNCSSMNPASSLEEENRNVAKLNVPQIDIDAMHSKYSNRKSVHEAGYDSMLTAILFIRLSACVHQTGKLPRGYRGQLENIAIGMTIDPAPGVSHLFAHNDLGPVSQEVRETDSPDEQGCQDSVLPNSLPRGLSDTGSETIAGLVRCGALVPRLGSEFWQFYGNKLRVFGTDAQFMEVGTDMEEAGYAK